MAQTLAEMKAAAAAKTASMAEKIDKIVSEEVDKKLEEAKTPIEGNKRYFCKVAGMRFIFEDGVEGYFHFGRLDVGPETFPDNWKQYQKELNNILGKQTNIFIPEALPMEAPVVTQNAKSEAEIAAADAAIIKGAKGQVNIKEEIGTAGTSGMPTDVNQSTIDPALQAAMMGANVIKGNAEEIAAQRNAGAAGSVS